MKQKIVIKVQIHCDKCRSEALKLTAAADGVISVALAGKERDQVVVIGEELDAASITYTLRKKVGYASIESVEEVKEKVEKAKGETEEKKDGKEEKKDGKGEKKDGKETNPTPTAWIPSCQCHQPQLQLYKVVHEPEPGPCTIM